MFLPFKNLCALTLGQKYNISTYMTQRIYKMTHSCSQWETCPHLHEVRSLPLTGRCTICLNRESAPHHGVVGRLVRWVRPLMDTLDIPGSGKSHGRGFSICLHVHALFLGPLLPESELSLSQVPSLHRESRNLVLSPVFLWKSSCWWSTVLFSTG